MALPVRPMVRARSGPRHSLDLAMSEYPWGDELSPRSDVGAVASQESISRSRRLHLSMERI